jgi:8-oxo-dGTP diphosphatase
MYPPHDPLPHHFTASGLVVCGEYILLVHHKRIGGWVPPGGHIEPDELPEQTVIREILEETGVTVEILSEPIPTTGDSEAFFLCVPLYLQSVLAIEGGERFFHVDLAFLCRPAAGNALDADGLPVLTSNEEVKASRWIKLDQVKTLPLAKNVAEAVEMLDRETIERRFVRVVSAQPDIDKNKR